MIRRPPRSTQGRSSAASDVYKRQTITGVEELARLARLRTLKRPRADTRDVLPVHRQSVALDDRAPDYRNLDSARSLLELGGLICGLRHACQRISAAVGPRRHGIALLDAKQNVSHCHRIALSRIDPDQVIPERRQHRLRDFPCL